MTFHTDEEFHFLLSSLESDLRMDIGEAHGEGECEEEWCIIDVTNRR